MSESDILKTILERIALGDKTAIGECISNYGNKIWALAIVKTISINSAENLALDIFTDIWKYADRFDSAKQTEEYFVEQIIRRRLIKNNKQA